MPMRKMFSEFFKITKLFESDIVDKKISRKINITAILTGLPVILIFVLLFFAASTVFSGKLPILDKFIYLLPLFTCLYFALVSFFTLQLFKIYLPENEDINKVNNTKFFFVALINPYMVIFSVIITICMLIIL